MNPVKRKSKNEAVITAVRTTTSGTSIYFDRPMRARLLTEIGDDSKEKQHSIRGFNNVTIGRKHRCCLIFHYVYDPDKAKELLQTLPWKEKDFKISVHDFFFGNERSRKFGIVSHGCKGSAPYWRAKDVKFIENTDNLGDDWVWIDIEAVNSLSGFNATIVSTKVTKPDGACSARVSNYAEQHGPCAIIRTLSSICRNLIKAGSTNIAIHIADPTAHLALTRGITFTSCAASALDVFASTVLTAEVRVRYGGPGHRRELYQRLVNRRNIRALGR